MKTMNYLATAIVALLWMGCSQEELVNETKGSANTIYATIEGASRSAVTDAGVFSWKSGDAITLVGENNGNVISDTYTYSGTGNGFNPPASPTVTTPVVAFYPANDDHNTTTFCLPNSYGDANSEYTEDTHAAMMATPPASGDTYAFMHLGGVMRFNVKNVPVGADGFRFIARGKKISGHFVISNEKTITTSDNTTDETAASFINSMVLISFKALTEAKDMTFYVPLPIGTYGDYQVAINKGGTDINYESTGVTNTINRRTLLLMPTFTCDGPNLLKGDPIDQVIKLSDGNQTVSLSGYAEALIAPGTDADATATLNYTPDNNNSTLTISDGSADGTVSGDSQGKVVVETAANSTVASCDINAPTLSVTLSAANNGTATYTEVNANTANETLIIDAGVTVQTLNIKGGHVRLGGEITAITRDNNNNDEVTYIILEQNATIPNNISDEKIKIVTPSDAWDGSTLTKPDDTDDAKTKVCYEINTPAELAWVLNNWNGSSTDPSRPTTIKLMNNIDFGGHEIYSGKTELGSFKSVTLEGNNYTIKNYKVAGVNKRAALFPQTAGITIKDLIIDGAIVGNNQTTEDLYAGALIGIASDQKPTPFTTTIENVVVKNSTIMGVNKVGGLVGQANGIHTVKNADVKNTTIIGYGTDAGSLGGLYGYLKVQGASTFTNSKMTGGVIVCEEGEDTASRGSGGFIGTLRMTMTNSSLTLTDCKVSNTDLTKSNTSNPLNEFVGTIRDGDKATLTINNENINYSQSAE